MSYLGFTCKEYRYLRSLLVHFNKIEKLISEDRIFLVHLNGIEKLTGEDRNDLSELYIVFS